MSATRGFGLAICCSVLHACQGPLEHTNPYHPDAVFEMTLQAPQDSSAAAGDTLQLTLSTTLDPLRQDAQWSATPDVLQYLGDGRFLTRAVGLAPVSVSVSAHFAERSVSTSVVLVQVPASLALECSGVNGCAFFTVGFARQVNGVLRDANGALVAPAVSSAPQTLVSRDPSIAVVEGDQRVFPSSLVRGVSAGSTWLVGNVGSIVDSVLITVNAQ